MLSNAAYGTDAERDELISLRYCFHSVAGEVGGEHGEAELGGGQALLYTYGPDADEILKQVERCLEGYPVRLGSFAVKVYGDADDPRARKEQVPLTGDSAI